MIILIAALIGAVLGGITAKRKKGNLFDVAQYALIFALLFALATLFYLIINNRGA